jgi:hypothetical protein
MAAVAIASITMKTDRPYEVARFWRDLLDYRVAPNHTGSVLLVGSGSPILIQPSAEPQPQGAIHLDLRPEDQQGCIDRALDLGAIFAKVGQSGQESWVVMADPGGNYFCVLQSSASHAAMLARDPGVPTRIE